MVELEKKIEGLVRELGQICKNKKITLTTAESCTGGGLAYFITKEPQCSAMLERGYVVYSNHAKESLLKISSKVLQVSGAVSQEVAQLMAEGALKNSRAQVAVATTGVAGEDAPGNQDPGIVWVACAGIDKKTLVCKFDIKGQRQEYCLQCILKAFELLLEFIVQL